jgi:hypothetical protein
MSDDSVLLALEQFVDARIQLALYEMGRADGAYGAVLGHAVVARDNLRRALQEAAERASP